MKEEKDYRKPCTLCERPRDVLVRCQIDETSQWHFVCPGSCWKRVSGGVVDGDEEHKFYRYGGMWKNKHEAVSAKKPKKKREEKQVQGETAAASTTSSPEQTQARSSRSDDNDDNAGSTIYDADASTTRPLWQSNVRDT